ncbi:hypothetical protein BD311DRAFT_222443 [Dichomitus squalens]|uniref:Uncharacterized protein n=1 Tax=Dichomitus squalens TaxID=114155 RepID=A0A4Q9MR47_9APHY|nr:hypothetical protein BD311DRAFT_222443 [Dichomitus squalens]
MYGTTEPIAQFYTSRYPEIAVEGRDTDSVTGVTGGVESSLGQPYEFRALVSSGLHGYSAPVTLTRAEILGNAAT